MEIIDGYIGLKLKKYDLQIYLEVIKKYIETMGLDKTTRRADIKTNKKAKDCSQCHFSHNQAQAMVFSLSFLSSLGTNR